MGERERWRENVEEAVCVRKGRKVEGGGRSVSGWTRTCSMCSASPDHIWREQLCAENQVQFSARLRVSACSTCDDVTYACTVAVGEVAASPLLACTFVKSLLVERAPCFLGRDVVRVTEGTRPRHARLKKHAVPVAFPIVHLVRKLWVWASCNRSCRKVVAIYAEIRARSNNRLEEQGAEHHHQKLLHQKERHRKQIQMLRCGDHAESGKVSVISVRFQIIIERDF